MFYNIATCVDTISNVISNDTTIIINDTFADEARAGDLIFIFVIVTNFVQNFFKNCKT